MSARKERGEITNIAQHTLGVDSLHRIPIGIPAGTVAPRKNDGSVRVAYDRPSVRRLEILRGYYPAERFRPHVVIKNRQ